MSTQLAKKANTEIAAWTPPEEDMGKGVSTAAEDNVVPLIYVLNDLSKVVKKTSSDYIPGAESGMIYLRNNTRPLIKGDEGIVFQPCAFTKDFVEWRPRNSGGGIVARHKTCPPGAESKEIEKDKFKLVLPNGNEIVETRYHAGFVHMPNGQCLPYVIPFTSTGHQVSKGWMTLISSHVGSNGSPYPSWAFKYKLTTRLRTKGDQSWYIMQVSDLGTEDNPNAGMVHKTDYEIGKNLHNAFMAGVTKAEDLEDHV